MSVEAIGRGHCPLCGAMLRHCCSMHMARMWCDPCDVFFELYDGEIGFLSGAIYLMQFPATLAVGAVRYGLPEMTVEATLAALSYGDESLRLMVDQLNKRLVSLMQ